MRRVLPILLAAVVAAIAVATGDATLLTALPVLALFALLAGGRFVGESHAVARLAAHRRRRRRVPVLALPSVWTRVRAGGGRLLAASAPRRGPPAHPLAA